MLRLDFSIAVALYLLASIGAVLCCWVLMRSRGFFKDFLNLSPRFIWCCNICTYTYFTTHKTDISTCPRCGSYNKCSIDREV